MFFTDTIGSKGDDLSVITLNDRFKKEISIDSIFYTILRERVNVDYWMDYYRDLIKRESDNKTVDKLMSNEKMSTMKSEIKEPSIQACIIYHITHFIQRIITIPGLVYCQQPIRSKINSSMMQLNNKNLTQYAELDESIKDAMRSVYDLKIERLKKEDINAFTLQNDLNSMDKETFLNKFWSSCLNRVLNGLCDLPLIEAQTNISFPSQVNLKNIHLGGIILPISNTQSSIESLVNTDIFLQFQEIVSGYNEFIAKFIFTALEEAAEECLTEEVANIKTDKSVPKKTFVYDRGVLSNTVLLVMKWLFGKRFDREKMNIDYSSTFNLTLAEQTLQCVINLTVNLAIECIDKTFQRVHGVSLLLNKQELNNLSVMVERFKKTSATLACNNLREGPADDNEIVTSTPDILSNSLVTQSTIAEASSEGLTSPTSPTALCGIKGFTNGELQRPIDNSKNSPTDLITSENDMKILEFRYWIHCIIKLKIHGIISSQLTDFIANLLMTEKEKINLASPADNNQRLMDLRLKHNYIEKASGILIEIYDLLRIDAVERYFETFSLSKNNNSLMDKYLYTLLMTPTGVSKYIKGILMQYFDSILISSRKGLIGKDLRDRIILFIGDKDSPSGDMAYSFYTPQVARKGAIISDGNEYVAKLVKDTSNGCIDISNIQFGAAVSKYLNSEAMNILARQPCEFEALVGTLCKLATKGSEIDVSDIGSTAIDGTFFKLILQTLFYNEIKINSLNEIKYDEIEELIKISEYDYTLDTPVVSALLNSLTINGGNSLLYHAQDDIMFVAALPFFITSINPMLKARLCLIFAKNIAILEKTKNTVKFDEKIKYLAKYLGWF